ncbi:MAG: hypothetical protein Tp1111DCM1126091_5 [Prokaryotic dsDNA virus sp.]|nr:MAG: hypothetical protein Tp1111DCM1126091_5 [Prokaryotic dsDNA virus sp.]|tara:strand:- start:11349 stop:11519 length:171 start_codon:yes stop_codon:yes gene_type:complete
MRINWVSLFIGIALALLVSSGLAVVTSMLFGDRAGDFVGFVIGFIGGSLAVQLSRR